MNSVFKILEQIGNNSSRITKEQILKNNINNEELQKILYYSFNPYLIFGIGKKTFKSIEGKSEFNDLFEMLDYVLINNTGTDETKLKINKFISNQSNEDEKWIKRILLKDLKIGISDKTINKIWKDFIPSFNVMLAKKYFDNEKKVQGDFIITTKLDGVRFLILKENGQVKMMSRQGKVMEGFIEIEEAAKQLPDNMVYDGEILAKNTEGLDSKTLYRKTMNLATKKGIKTGLIHNCFDIIPIDEFKSGESKEICIDRKNKLHKIFDKIKLHHIVEVPILYIGNDKNKITELLNEAISKDQEGVMVNLADKSYKCKRTDVILKVKKFNDADVRVVDVIEGTGKNINKLGAIKIQFIYNDKIYTCDCGSGFNDKERLKYWKNPSLLINKIVTIGYFEISKNQKGSYGLRFPTWKGIIRDDKDEISMY